MSVSTTEILQWAQAQITQTSACEVTRRAATSRAYYASLMQAMQVFSVPADFREKSSHANAIRALEIKANQPGQGKQNAGHVVKWLNKMKNVRVTADYELAHDFSEDDAQRALAMAEQIFENCANAQRLMQQQQS